MNAEEAKAIASAYLAQHPVGHDDYEWIVVEPRRVAGGWYFEFESRCRRDLPKDQWEVFGGAPGFVAGGDGTVRVVGWDELPDLLEGSVPGDGHTADASSGVTKSGAGVGFHLHPMYIVYVVVAVVALLWDWRVLVGFAVLMAVAWLFAHFDDRRQQTASNQANHAVSDGAAGEVAPEGVVPELCPQCQSPLFVVRPGVTTAEEIAAFARSAQGWCGNPEATAGWMPPGLYCANGCYAMHTTPIPEFEDAGSAADFERIPRPVRITVADVARDGGSYEMAYDSDRGESIKVVLRVITEGALRRVGYRAPRLSRCDPVTCEAIDSWEIDWDEAEQLADLLRPLLAFNGDIRLGSAARAREMVLYLKRRGGV